MRFREEAEDSALHKILCGSVATGHHGYYFFCIQECTCLLASYLRVSLKVAAFHEPDDTQGPAKRPRILPANLDEDIEIPSLKGSTLGDLGSGPISIDNPFSQPESQQTPKTGHAKAPTTQITNIIPNRLACSPGLASQKRTDGKERTARELREATKLRQMVGRHPEFMFTCI